MEMTKYLLAVLAGYLLGSLSISIMLSKIMGCDVRQKGSGNAGATNMARVYGIKAGIATLFGDMLKTGVSLLLGWLLAGEWGFMAAGISCMLGHCFPVYHGFKGGKGVSAGAAIALAIDWRVFAAVIVLFLIVALTTKKVSLASICAAIALAVLTLLICPSIARIILASVSMLLVVFRHWENIRRLMNGTEKNFSVPRKTEK